MDPSTEGPTCQIRLLHSNSCFRTALCWYLQAVVSVTKYFGLQSLLYFYVLMYSSIPGSSLIYLRFVYHLFSGPPARLYILKFASCVLRAARPTAN